MKKNLKNLFVTSLLLFAVLFSVTGCKSGEKKAGSITLKIIETTDAHGAVFPYDFIGDKASQTSLAQVHTYVQQQRSDKSQEVILLDNGDILQGQPLVYYYNFEETGKTHILADVMNYMGYDAASVGNHDIEAGHPVYDRLVKSFSFPWLSANAVKTGSSKTYFEPYTIITRKGYKIAVLGMTSPGIPNWLPEALYEGMAFEDMIETARKWVKVIKKKEKPDLLIGLFHSGVDYTYGGRTADTPGNENASKLVAQQVDGFDIIFVGHDHKNWNETVRGPNGNDVLIMGGLSSCKTVAQAEVSIFLDETSGTWKKNINGQIVEIAGIEPDAQFITKFNESYEAVKTYVSKKIGTFESSISTREAMFTDSPFVDLIHKIQLEITGADVSFAAPLSFDTSIQKGDVFVRDMFKLYKYENLLYTMELSGEEIKDFLEYSYGLWFNTMKDENDHIMNFKKDETGKIIFSERYNSYELVARYYNYDSAAGIIYQVDVSKPEGQRVSILSMADGSSFDPAKKYKVAINSYRGNGGGNHLVKGAGIPKEKLMDRITSSTIKDLRYFLMKWIEKQGTVTPEALGNWQVVPAAWWDTASVKDFELLYREKPQNMSQPGQQ